MEPFRRKFKSDVSATSIDKLIEKRQRKRYFATTKKPYQLDGRAAAAGPKQFSIQVGQTTVLQDIPQKLLPKYKSLANEHKQREFDKPEHWVQPKREIKVSRADNFKMEADQITKTVDKRAVWSRAARVFINARGVKPVRPSSHMTAKGYLLSRIDNSCDDTCEPKEDND